jgi:hypothetical protein
MMLDKELSTTMMLVIQLVIQLVVHNNELIGTCYELKMCDLQRQEL